MKEASKLEPQRELAFREPQSTLAFFLPHSISCWCLVWPKFSQGTADPEAWKTTVCRAPYRRDWMKGKHQSKNAQASSPGPLAIQVISKVKGIFSEVICPSNYLITHFNCSIILIIYLFLRTSQNHLVETIENQKTILKIETIQCSPCLHHYGFLGL